MSDTPITGLTSKALIMSLTLACLGGNDVSNDRRILIDEIERRCNLADLVPGLVQALSEASSTLDYYLHNADADIDEGKYEHPKGEYKQALAEARRVMEAIPDA